MSQMSSAPQDSGATVNADAGGSGASVNDSMSLDSTDSIVAALDASVRGESAGNHQGEAAARESAQPREASDQEYPGEQDAAPESPPNEAATAEAGDAEIAAPASWTREEKAHFAALPAEVRKTITRREAERESFVSAKAQEAAAARGETAKLLQYARTGLQQALQQAQAAIDGEFAGINWLELQQRNPETFLQLDAMRKQRHQAVSEAVQAAQALAAREQQARRHEAAAALQGEMPRAVERVRAIIGEGPDLKAWRNEAVEYLRKSGVPDGHIAGLSRGYECEIIAKAMAYDKMKSNAAAAEKKVAEALRVMKPGGNQGDPGAAAGKKAAWKRLAENPKSTEAIMEALNFL